MSWTLQLKHPTDDDAPPLQIGPKRCRFAARGAARSWAFRWLASDLGDYVDAAGTCHLQAVIHNDSVSTIAIVVFFGRRRRGG